MKLVGRGKFTRQANAKLSRKLEFDVGGSNTPAKSPQGPGPGAPIQTDTDRIQVYREALRNKYALSELEKVMLEALEGGQHGVLVADGQILVSDQVPYGSLYIDDLARAARLCSFVRLEARQK